MVRNHETKHEVYTVIGVSSTYMEKANSSENVLLGQLGVGAIHPQRVAYDLCLVVISYGKRLAPRQGVIGDKA